MASANQVVQPTVRQWPWPSRQHRDSEDSDMSDNLRAAYPLTLYYDASCPLCLAEMTAIKRLDHHDRLHLVDCSAPGFDDAACRAADIGVEALMRRLHARDADGHWRIGVPAFAVAYAAVDARGVAAFFATPRLAGILGRLYGWLADHRQGFSRLGLNGLFGAWVAWLARRAQRRAVTCHAGVCER
jgi:predicted DCC family thiol-disulfide oxidoreductase YuxK